MPEPPPCIHGHETYGRRCALVILAGGLTHVIDWLTLESRPSQDAPKPPEA